MKGRTLFDRQSATKGASALVAALKTNPAAEVTVDLKSNALILPDGRSVSFCVDTFSRRCLLEGVDELGYLQSFQDRVVAYEKRLSEVSA